MAIIDLVSGAQPMSSRDGNITVTVNGEIYDHVELRCKLETRGHRFLTASDTAVIIHANDEEWGQRLQCMFNGMWAFALWDKRKGTLLVSHDRLGEKPRYYSVTDNTFLFGSEIKALLAYGMEAVPNYEITEIYLALGYFPGMLLFTKE